MKKKMMIKKSAAAGQGDFADWVTDLDWLTEHLAVGAAFPSEGAAKLAADHGISAVVDLREEDRHDVDALRAAGIELLHLPTPDMEPARPAELDKGVAFVREHSGRGERVLIHCQHGIGRSALLALCVLVDAGREPLAAIEHAKDRRERISPSPSQFAGWCEWLRSRGHEPPSMHDFGCIAYRHMAKG
jgi:protein-tyrosine phosphatase